LILLAPSFYKGRFAPSPTGPLHLGSLYTALASFLQARSQQGAWLVRIDDLDTPRNVKGASDLILSSLDRFGLHWDESVYYQSQHLDDYQHFLTQLTAAQLLYPCICSRKTLQQSASAIYPNFCRHLSTLPTTPYALRLKTCALEISFSDLLQGQITHNIAEQHGDFIVQRKDKIIAYLFAVVIDDWLQGITEVVRGSDLLHCTPAQIYIRQSLDFKEISYAHVPIVVDLQGQKLSKQTRAEAVTLHNPSATLFYLLNLLRQQPPADLVNEKPEILLDWAIQHWQPMALLNEYAVRVR